MRKFNAGGSQQKDPSSKGRFIPACAGNTAASIARRLLKAVHPRVCGEHERGEVCRDSVTGSSPRVRGTRYVLTDSPGMGRFIPACAGNTFRKCPRSADVVGSSPRVRGTRSLSRVGSSRTRFIPACAGNTPCMLPALMATTVHPRVCGEHPILVVALVWLVGSSPRVRGTPPSIVPFSQDGRFIPACAGNTNISRLRNTPLPVHPRVCGEHVPLAGLDPAALGSSPRVRGTPLVCSLRLWPPRFIPACAGNTATNWTSKRSPPVHPRVCGEHHSARAGLPGRSGSSPRVRGTRLQT